MLLLSPSVDKVQQLIGISGVYSNIDKNFIVKTEDNDLIFEVGSFQGGITGRRKFAENIDGKLKEFMELEFDRIS